MVLKARQELSPLENAVAECSDAQSAKTRFEPTKIEDPAHPPAWARELRSQIIQLT